MIFSLLVSYFFNLLPTYHEPSVNFLPLSSTITINQESPILDVVITANQALAVDAESGQVLFEKNLEQTHPIASITKLMSAIVFLELKPNFERQVIFNKADRTPGNIAYFNIGEKLTLRQAFFAGLVASDNESIMVLVHNSGLSEDEFVLKMNEMANELDMLNSNFADPTGLDINNTATPHDLIKLLAKAEKYELIRQATTMPSYSTKVVGLKEKDRELRFYNTDWLTSSKYLDVVIGKTGHLPEAGYCLATKLISTQGQEIYIIVLGSATVQDRFQDVKAIEYYIGKKFQWNTSIK